MTLREALREAAGELEAQGVDSARFEAELLMRHVLCLDRATLFTRLERDLAHDELADYSSLIRRRVAREPAAYITGRREFFGLDFDVAPCVLIPRPETEVLVEKALEYASASGELPLLIADVGTGCGAIAVALAVHLPQARVYATDVSSDALEVARCNCDRHGVASRVTLLLGNLTVPLPEPVHLIVANLPYVGDSDLPTLAPEIRKFEPALALDGGRDGIDVIERLLSSAGPRLREGGALLLEIGHSQAGRVAELAGRHFPTSSITVARDLGGVDRVVIIMTAVDPLLN